MQPVLIQRGNKVLVFAGNDFVVALSFLRHAFTVSRAVASVDLVRASLRAALRGFSFNHAGHNALFRRLTGPLIQGRSDTIRLEMPESFPSIDHKTSGSCLALIASELEIDQDEVESKLAGRLGWQLSKPFLSVRVDDPSGNAAVLDRIALEASSLAGVAILIGARRAPIRAIALVLRKITEAAGANIEVLVLLVRSGKESPEEHALREELSTWRNFLAIHDLRVGLEGWPR
jgi:hypothetical protein